MAGIRVELANPKLFKSPEEYVERHLAPITAELHRLATEFFVPGSTSEELSVDMTCTVPPVDGFRRLDRLVDTQPKHVIFDGSAYFLTPKDVLRSKQAKIQLSASVYVKGGGGCTFRLVRDDGMPIEGSWFEANGASLQRITKQLPFGDQKGCISPDSRTYYIEAGHATYGSLPVCRRFSLAFIYV